MANGKTLCLNMIVKNEMANLDRCLRAVADHIACWVIGDTGSSDGTQDFIQSFFAERGIPGELHSFPFLNFGQARNAALEHAAASKLAYDYLLLDDADMELVVEDPGFRAKLEEPGYLLIQRTESGLTYWNTRLMRRDTGARYHGVTHEYLDVPGAKNLQGVWYKDHASGGSRGDKFERDINLLLQGLEEEPGNSRYWFYLAQSYRDAGQKAKAAETYAKRAAMGGWDEEAWYARLQQARCLRDLKDDDGFTREALAAFNQRPQRAEPLYDLARFYRERGDHAASVLFSEFGLTLPRPNDILFLEDFVYTAGLLEEFSIAANYAHDAARKDRGFAACNSLALNRDVPEGTRKLARTNLFYYIEPAGAMMPSFAAHPVVFTPPPGYHLTNPSIARLGEQLVMVQRTVNYVITGDNQYETPSGAPVHTRNFLLRLDPALQIQSSLEILPPVDMPEPSFQPVTGFEDMRLFAWRGELWSSSTVRELTAEGWCDQVLARIDQSTPGDFRLTDWRALRPEGPRRHEKNWMPLVDDDRLQFIYLCDPTRILDEQAQKVAETVPPIAAEQFRGGSQAIAFDGGWLALIHEVLEPAASRPRTYQHRFVWLDEARALRRVSRAFYFQKKGVEFAAGLAWHPDGKRLMISFSVGDHESWIATVEADDVLGVLQDVESLPSGTTGGLRGDSLPVRLPTKEAAKSGENPTRPGSSADIDPARNRDPEEHIDNLLQTLRHLVGGRPIAMLDWPSYVNSGDHLIWLGEKVLLKERLGCKVLYECSLHQFDFLAVSRLPSDAVLVMHGGGNFGDLYDQHERFREATAAGFSDRRIIFMPQTVRFASQKNLEESARRLKLHPDLHVMARDRKSFEIIRSQMGLTNCYLHIDSAFALQPIVTALQRNFAVNAQHDAVYLLRGDVESTRELSPPDGAVRYDWARTYDLDPFAKDLPSPESIGFGAACFEGALDTVSWERLCAVVRMLSTGQRIVTDRLHGHILAIMMKKQHELHDNNYGKNRSFHQTWTSTCPLVTFVGPGGNAERVVETPPEAEIKPALTPRKSTWVPDAPAAGTELMVARLRSRLGHELDRINLKVNHPGDEPRDQRPLVIWVHHDMDQQYMQWCTDKARTALVDCFVFVSNWQRERYLNKFGLPPERCVVLRNATEVDQTPREWRRDGVWRCAYTSTPFRGLSVLLDAWQRLSPANAELHVWSSMSLYKMDDAPYKHILEKAESTPGVIYHGLAPNDELRQALRDIHFLVYPCTFAETSCLAVIEAMAAGCRVIAPSFGALPETTGGYARIYPFNPDPQEHGITFCENLAAELASPWAGDPGLSLEQQSHCASVYNWPRRLAEWRQVIEWACKQAKTELRG